MDRVLIRKVPWYEESKEGREEGGEESDEEEGREEIEEALSALRTYNRRKAVL